MMAKPQEMREIAMEQTKTTQARAVGFAILAAALYALNAPLSKVLLGQVPARMMAALLYLGAGSGMLLLRLVQKSMGKSSHEAPLTRKELPYTLAMVVLDVAAPIFLMLGLTGTSAASASLLNNFEIVATSLIALLIFRERISKRLWLAIGLVTLSSIVLSLEGGGNLQFSLGSLLVLLACCCWGLENNCTRALSEKDPLEIVVVKGFGSGLGAMIVALVCGDQLPQLLPALGALLLGFVAYGLSIFFYIYAQRTLGAAKTSTWYAISPFIGVGLSLVVFRQIPGLMFWAALVIMAAGAYFAANDGQ